MQIFSHVHLFHHLASLALFCHSYEGGQCCGAAGFPLPRFHPHPRFDLPNGNSLKAANPDTAGRPAYSENALPAAGKHKPRQLLPLCITLTGAQYQVITIADVS